MPVCVALQCFEAREHDGKIFIRLIPSQAANEQPSTKEEAETAQAV
jgi:hypothetical protein